VQITAPAPIIYLPENLWSLFSRPGRELLIRVLNVEGKTLDLELGGDRFQARVGGTVNPEDFKPGSTIKVRVLRVGHPIVLQLVEEEEAEKAQTKDLTLFYLVKESKNPAEESQTLLKKDLDLLATFVRDLVGGDKKDEKVEKKDELLKKILGDKIKALKFLYQHGRIIVPFVFYDDRSWGFLELEPPKEEGSKVKLFYVKLYFEYLGLVECYLGYGKKELFLDLYFASRDAYNLAKKEVRTLEAMIGIEKRFVKISINTQEVLPGYILEKEG